MVASEVSVSTGFEYNKIFVGYCMTCYCGSPEDYADCCAPLHQGIRQAQTPEQLMRSRFSAYVLAQVPYIEQTYHSTKRTANARAEIDDFARSATFISLQVLSSPENSPLLPRDCLPSNKSPETADIGYVHFIVKFFLDDKLQILEEESRFVREDQQWRYLDGVLTPHPSQKTGRNDSCPCGSGKKYKTCRPHWLNGAVRSVP